MSATTNTNTKIRTPKLLLKTISRTTTPVIATAPMYAPSTTAAGSFYLPAIKKNHRKGGRNHKKHLRKPPSFDTYLHSPTSPTTITPRGYLARAPSLSSSYSSTSSLTDSVCSNEDLMYSCGKSNISTLSMPPRLRRGSSATYKVRFAEVSDDGSSIVSSASSCTDDAEDWDANEEDDEEEFIFVNPPRHYSYHKKNVST